MIRASEQNLFPREQILLVTWNQCACQHSLDDGLHVQEVKSLRQREAPEKVDTASSAGAILNKETGNETAPQASELTEKEILDTRKEETDVRAPGDAMAPVLPECFDDPTTFISMVLEWTGHVADAPCSRTTEGRPGPIMHRKALIRALLEPAETKA